MGWIIHYFLIITDYIFIQVGLKYLCIIVYWLIKLFFTEAPTSNQVTKERNNSARYIAGAGIYLIHKKIHVRGFKLLLESIIFKMFE